MLKVKIVFLAALVLQLGLGQAQPLFKIVRDDKVGYINAKGEVVIQPTFLNGNEFSEGLAAVREYFISCQE